MVKFAKLLVAPVLLTYPTKALKTQPNIILLVTDQERAPPKYESPALKQYRQENFKGRQKIASHSLNFKNHYISSAACVPSRAVLYTGQHLDMHNVDSTNGIAKSSGDVPQWLVPGWIPTMGDYFRAAGYSSHYIGKWHLSVEDILDESGDVMREPLERLADLYRNEDLLDKFGFSGWTGPEPHSPQHKDAGIVRDKQFTDQTVEYIKERNATYATDDTPFFLAINLVNPHDIIFFQSAIWVLFGEPSNDKCQADLVDMPPSFRQNLDHPGVPSVYRQYVTAVNSFFNKDRRKIWSWEDEVCFYYYLMRQVDAHIERIYDTLKDTPFFDDTVFAFTADHGELLGAHGGGIEKWHNAYEETVHVPFTLSNPGFQGEIEVTQITSHIDILPTLLSFTGVTEQVLMERLRGNITEIQKLPGKNLLGSVAEVDEYAFFYTRDNILYGERSNFRDTREYRSFNTIFGTTVTEFLLDLKGPRYGFDGPWATNSIQAVVFRHFDDHGHSKIYKFVKHFDDPALWSSPFQNHTVTIKGSPHTGSPLLELGFGSSFEDISRFAALPEEFELFDLQEDPGEMNNLAGNCKFDGVLAKGMGTLEKAVWEMVLQPSRPVPVSERVQHPHTEKLELSPWFYLMVYYSFGAATLLYGILVRCLSKRWQGRLGNKRS